MFYKFISIYKVLKQSQQCNYFSQKLKYDKNTNNCKKSLKGFNLFLVMLAKIAKIISENSSSKCIINYY